MQPGMPLPKKKRAMAAGRKKKPDRKARGGEKAGALSLRELDGCNWR